MKVILVKIQIMLVQYGNYKGLVIIPAIIAVMKYIGYILAILINIYLFHYSLLTYLNKYYIIHFLKIWIYMCKLT